MASTNENFDNFDNIFEIIPASAELFPEIIGMSDAYLGDGMYTEESLEKIVEDEYSRFYLIRDRESGGTAAIFYFHCGTVGDICEKYPYVDRSLCEDGTMLGILRSIAIKERYRKTGLSEYLITRFSNQLFSEFGVSRIFVMAWVKQYYVPANHCLNNCGFRSLYQVEHPWYNEVGLRCNICNGERCVCDGLLFTKGSNFN